MEKHELKIMELIRKMADEVPNKDLADKLFAKIIDTLGYLDFQPANTIKGVKMKCMLCEKSTKKKGDSPKALCGECIEKISRIAYAHKKLHIEKMIDWEMEYDISCEHDHWLTFPEFDLIKIKA